MLRAELQMLRAAHAAELEDLRAQHDKEMRAAFETASEAVKLHQQALQDTQKTLQHVRDSPRRSPRRPGEWSNGLQTPPRRR